MLLVVLSVSMAASVLGVCDLSARPSTPAVKQLTHSADVTIENVPDCVALIRIKALEVNDLTGNRWEDGYIFAVNAAVKQYYYPELKDHEYYEFKVQYCETVDVCSEWSLETGYQKSIDTKYTVMETGRYWPEAKQKCEEDQTQRLAIIKNGRENKQVQQLLALHNIGAAWIGLSDANFNKEDMERADWRWVDGSKAHYHNFELNSHETKSSAEVGSAVAILKDGKWERRHPDSFDDPKLEFICESTPKKSFTISQTDGGIGVDEAIVQ